MWCDVWCRVERNQYDDQGCVIISGTACAYCGRTELRHAYGYALANRGHDTRALQAYLGHKNIQHTVRYSECH